MSKRLVEVDSLVQDFNVFQYIRIGKLSVLHVLQRLGQTARDHLGIEAAHLMQSIDSEPHSESSLHST